MPITRYCCGLASTPFNTVKGNHTCLKRKGKEINDGMGPDDDERAVFLLVPYYCLPGST